MRNNGKLFLIPSPIAAGAPEKVIPAGVRNELTNIRHFLAEDVRTARRYLSGLKLYDRIEDLSFSVLNKDTADEQLPLLMAPITAGQNMGVISESGCPGVADPGALAVRFAHANDITIVPLVGPSSIILALMASGLNGQHFAFHGYLPIQSKEAAKTIRDLERESRLKNQTQIFIETPYRNTSLFATLLKTLQPQTRLCVAVDLTGENEFVVTKTIENWRANPVEISRIPAVFLFLA
jgi:16S rRNA (cytidine1402-2'-O)-methyltransferase